MCSTLNMGRFDNPPREMTPQVIDEVLSAVRFLTHELYRAEFGKEQYLLETEVDPYPHWEL